jgi:hypothetical protein
MNAFWGYADTYGCAIPLVFLMVRKRKLSLEEKTLTWYLIFSIIIFGFSNYLADHGTNNHFLYHLFADVEFFFIAIYFSLVIRNTLVKKIIPYVIAGLIIFSVLNVLVLHESLTSWPTNTFFVEFFMIIVMCFVYFFELTSSNDILQFYKVESFWVIAGFFIYYSLSFSIVILYKYVAEYSSVFVYRFWILQIMFYLLKNVLIGVGFLCRPTR